MRQLQTIILILSVTGIAYAVSGGPPAGFTGAPGDNNSCVLCHSSFEVNSGPGSVTVSGTPAFYEAGRNYLLTVTTEQAGQPRYGYQLTVIDGAGNRAGTLEPVGSDSQLNGSTGQGGRQYVNHTAAGINPSSPGYHTWQLRWTAPATSAGAVTFYAAGNAADGDTSSLNDYIYTTNVAAAPTVLAPLTQAFTATGGGGTVNVNVPGGQTWTAVSNDSFITVTAGGGTGPGVVEYTVQANPSSTSRRIGSLTIAGQTFTVRQGANFTDVPISYLFYTEIGKLSAWGITQGCGGGNYCPEQVVTREQMAAFIIRARGNFNPPAPGAQRFGDVPPSNIFYAFIEQMAVLGITLGCGGGNYCPGQPVLREQMAAFMIRALGEFNPPTPPSQRFADVPPSNIFYNFIDRMAVLGITQGCGGGNYCPSAQVTRGQMAAFLVRAFQLNQ